MNGEPINVLAVWDNFIAPEKCAGTQHDCVEARAAMVDLIKAARAIHVAIRCGEHEARINQSNPLSVQALNRALAQIGELP